MHFVFCILNSLSWIVPKVLEQVTELFPRCLGYNKEPYIRPTLPALQKAHVSLPSLRESLKLRKSSHLHAECFIRRGKTEGTFRRVTYIL